MTLSTVLAILKYLGTSISGIAGIWGITSETKEKTSGRLTKWGKVAVVLAISGLVVALTSQATEQVIDVREKHLNEQAQSNEKELKEREHKVEIDDLQSQLALARGERTRFESICISVVYALQVTDPFVASAVKELDSNFGKPGSPPFQGVLDGGDVIYVSARDLPHGSLTSVEKLMSAIRNEGPFGFKLWISRRDGAIVPETQPTPFGPEPDLFANAGFDLWGGGSLCYERKADSSSGAKLSVVFNSQPAMAESWQSNGNIVGIDDLENAGISLTIQLMHPSSTSARLTAPGLGMPQILLTFGKSPCLLDNVTVAPARYGEGMTYNAVLPDAATILTGRRGSGPLGAAGLLAVAPASPTLQQPPAVRLPNGHIAPWPSH